MCVLKLLTEKETFSQNRALGASCVFKGGVTQELNNMSCIIIIYHYAYFSTILYFIVKFRFKRKWLQPCKGQHNIVQLVFLSSVAKLALLMI